MICDEPGCNLFVFQGSSAHEWADRDGADRVTCDRHCIYELVDRLRVELAVKDELLLEAAASCKEAADLLAVQKAELEHLTGLAAEYELWCQRCPS